MDQEKVAEQVKYIFDVFKKAGISMVDAAELTSVSRESLYRWRSGNNITDKFRLNFVYANAVRLGKAVQLKKLPLKNKLKKDQRILVLRGIIKEMSSK